MDHSFSCIENLDLEISVAYIFDIAQQQQQSAESFRQPMDCVLDAVRHVVMRRKAMSEAE